MGVVGFGALRSSFTPIFPSLHGGKRQGEQQFCNIITTFHFATTSQQGGRWEFSLYFQREKSESRKGVLKEERRCSVWNSAVWELSVEGDELCLCTAGNRMRDLLLCLGLLLLLRWATRGGNLTRHRDKRKETERLARRHLKITWSFWIEVGGVSFVIMPVCRNHIVNVKMSLESYRGITLPKKCISDLKKTFWQTSFGLATSRYWIINS